MISADALDTIIIGVASLAIAGMSFVYASRAQAAGRATHSGAVSGVASDAARAAGQRLLNDAPPVDSAAYARARELYESAIDSLQEEVARLAAENVALRGRIDRLEDKIRQLTASQ